MKTVSEMPGRIALLPQDKTGRPVPWFVHWEDGTPDFRVIGQGKMREAVTGNLCWVCGVPFARQEDRVFLVGPMCAVNRVSSEPPSHLDCAVFSAQRCPFLSVPRMVRRERGMENAVRPAGVMLARNPGAVVAWVTRYRSWSRVTAPGGFLFSIGDPVRTLWFAEGREATRAEVLASIDSGLPALRDAAEAQGPHAVAELEQAHKDALALIPAEVVS